MLDPCTLKTQVFAINISSSRAAVLCLFIFYLFFSVFMFLSVWNIFNVKKVNIRTNRSSSLLQKTLLLKASSVVTPFNSNVTLWHHSMSPCSAGSGVCELTNQRILGNRGGGVLKIQKLKQRFRYRGNTVDSMGKLILSIKACKSIPKIKWWTWKSAYVSWTIIRCNLENVKGTFQVFHGCWKLYNLGWPSLNALSLSLSLFFFMPFCLIFRIRPTCPWSWCWRNQRSTMRRSKKPEYRWRTSYR